MKRLVIYFHYDPAGQIDTACRIAVQAMARYGKVLFVTNGTLTPADRAWVQQCGARLLERENTGFDVGAYKDALLMVGRKRLALYDELVLMNFTLAGPVFSLGPMFAAMDARRDLAFWGLTRHYAMKSRRFGGDVPEHLQSHFLAVRPALFNSEDFWQYWREMPLPESYEQSIIRHETRFTPYFAAKGYAWDSYVQTADLQAVFVNPIMACPKELMQHRGCAFFKRRSLFTPYDDELRRTDGLAAQELYTYVKSATAFPIDLLLLSLLPQHPLADFAANLHWQYVVGENGGGNADLPAAGLQLLHYTPPEADPTTDWYTHAAAAKADTLLAQAVQLFEEHPLLGVVSPAPPQWKGCAAARRAQWQQAVGPLRAGAAVPVDARPLPAPNCGWVLVRQAAFPQGVPPCRSQLDAWQLTLAAQANGYYAATFETAAQAAGRAAYLDVYETAASQPTAVAKQLGRLVKHKLQK